MNRHLEQATHNQHFHDSIETNFEGRFYDWKITVLFYVALHYLQALADSRSISIGETHFEVEQNVNPDKVNAKMRISKGAWREYKSLSTYSRTARYQGITDYITFEELKQTDHQFCLKHLDNFKKYLNSQGLDC